MSDLSTSPPGTPPPGSTSGSTPGSGYRLLTAAERVDVVAQLSGAIAAMQAELGRVLVAVDDEGDWRPDGATDAPSWLVGRTGVTRAHARETFRVAHALEALPQLRAVFASGAVGWDQIRPATRFATPATDEDLAADLPGWSAAQVEGLARRLVPRTNDEAATAHARRALHWRPDHAAGGFRYRGFLPTDQAAAVNATLSALAKAAGPDPATGLWDPFATRCADALHDLATGERRPGDAALVVLHVDANSLTTDPPTTGGSGATHGSDDSAGPSTTAGSGAANGSAGRAGSGPMGGSGARAGSAGRAGSSPTAGAGATDCSAGAGSSTTTGSRTTGGSAAAAEDSTVAGSRNAPGGDSQGPVNGGPPARPEPPAFHGRDGDHRDGQDDCDGPRPQPGEASPITSPSPTDQRPDSRRPDSRWPVEPSSDDGRSPGPQSTPQNLPGPCPAGPSSNDPCCTGPSPNDPCPVDPRPPGPWLARPCPTDPCFPEPCPAGPGGGGVVTNGLIDSMPVGRTTVLRFLCDADVEHSIDGPDGTTIGIGRRSRAIPDWMRRHIEARDRTCRFPGCERPIRHVHHNQHWTRDEGPTNSNNLTGECWAHHRLVHEGGWEVTGNADGQLTFTSPYGRQVTSTRQPLRPTTRAAAARISGTTLTHDPPSPKRDPRPDHDGDPPVLPPASSAPR